MGKPTTKQKEEPTVPYESPHGFHRHKCDKCGYVWEHANTCVNNTALHTCPGCGTEEWYWYKGPEAPTKPPKK